MRSMKKICLFLSIVLMMIVVSIIIINALLGLSNRTLNQLNGANINLRTEIEKTALPLGVLNNIAGQTVDTVKKKVVLTKAFSDNLDKCGKSIMVTDILLTDMTDHLNILERTWFYRSEVGQLSQSISELSDVNKKLEAIVMEIVIDDNLKNYDKLVSANNYHQLILDEYQSYQIKYLDTSLNIRESQLFIINILVGLLVIAIIALLLLISRFINNDLRVISNTYTQIKNHIFSTRDIWLSKPYFNEEIEIHKVIEHYFADEKLTSEFNAIVSKEYVMDNIIDHLLEKTHEIMGVDRVGISFYDESNGVLASEYGVAIYDRLYLNVGYKSNITKSSLFEVISNKRGYINNDLLASVELYPESVSLKLVVKEGIRSNMSIPLIMNNKVFGIVFFSSTKSFHFTEENYDLATRLIYEITGALNRSYLMKVFMTRITMAFARLVDQKDIETGDHLNRMVRYSVLVAESLKEMDVSSHPIDYKLINEIEKNAATHDIGKVGTPDSILKKPGMLTEEEFQIIREHTLIGAEIFSNLNQELSTFNSTFFSTAERITRFHHEKWDGSGYPYGLSGYSIPLEARIVAIADVFDALTSKRIYKKALSFEESLDVISDSSGTHFDPIIVKAFYNCLSKIREVYNSSNKDEACL